MTLQNKNNRFRPTIENLEAREVLTTGLSGGADLGIAEVEVIPGEVTLTALDQVSAESLTHTIAVAADEQPPDTSAYKLDKDLDLYSTGNDWYNWLGEGEKWFMSAATDQWHFMLPGGNIYAWEIGDNLASSDYVGDLNSVYFDHLDLVYNAQDQLDSMDWYRYALDQKLSLHVEGGNYYENWFGQGEKWLRSGVNEQWYFLLPNGELRQWDGAHQYNPETSVLVANLTESVHASPDLLHKAQHPPFGNPLTIYQEAEKSPEAGKLNVDGFAELKIGMTQPEVETILGGPPGDYGVHTGGQAFVFLIGRPLPPAGATEQLWHDDNHMFELYFDEDGRLIHFTQAPGYTRYPPGHFPTLPASV